MLHAKLSQGGDQMPCEAVSPIDSALAVALFLRRGLG